MDSSKFQQQKKEFEELICNSTIERLKKKAIDGKLLNCSIRSLCWKIFLGCIPNDLQRIEWIKVLNIHRKEYNSLITQYKIDPHSEGKDLDPLINHPLSQSEDSVWKKYWQNLDLEKEIVQDIERLYPENEFFQLKHVKECMQRVLFIYSRQNPQLSYKQGMHELLAPIVYVLEREKIFIESNNSLESEELAKLMDANFIEHDAFMMFNHLMRVVKEWFMLDAYSPNVKKKEETSNDGTNNSNTQQSNQTDSNEERTTPVVKKSRFIQNFILKKFDPSLCSHLINLKIEPQVYMLRWIRLLLCREFHIDDTLLVWDAIFAHSKDFALIDYLCAFMLIFIRQQLLDKDFTGCMRRLFKYPPVEDVHFIIEKAISLQDGTTLPLPSIVSPSSSPNQQHPVHQRRESFSIHLQTPKILDPLTATVKQILTGDDHHTNHTSHSSNNNKSTTSNSNSNSMKEEVDRLKNVQNHMANRLERIIYSLQKEVIERPEAAEFINDSLLLSIAELKQVKDILIGLLPVENQLVLPRQIVSNSNEPNTNSNSNSTPQPKSTQGTANPSSSNTKQNEETDPLGAFTLI